MNFFKPLSESEKNYKKGVFLLLGVIFAVQLIWWFKENSYEEQIDSVIDVKVDTLMQNTSAEIHLKPFDANNITAYKAYVLGLSNEAYEQLRINKLNNTLYSLEEFQKVSGISDSLRVQISPYLKFPLKLTTVKKKQSLKNINTATADELRAIYGIGPVLSKRIIAYRASLGKYDSMEQLYKVYALDSIVVHRIMKQYEIK